MLTEMSRLKNANLNDISIEEVEKIMNDNDDVDYEQKNILIVLVMNKVDLVIIRGRLRDCIRS